MAKSPMATPLLSVVICALLLIPQANGSSKTSAHPNDTFTSCIAGERSALVGFKAGLSDPTNFLSSWQGDDCCRWKGVHCSNRTSHVVRLDLQGRGCVYSDVSMQMLGGNISSSVLGLQHLRYLDLSCNAFYGVQIPEFLGSFRELRYLNLSWSSFTGRIPPQLGNLSNLRYLDLDSSYEKFNSYSWDITWLSRLPSLQHLDMTQVNLSTIVHWLPVVNMLPSLEVLRLGWCGLKSSPGSLRLSNLTSLETLDISGNSFNKHSTPNWFWDLHRLKYLDISDNGFYGRFPDEIGNLTFIVDLELSINNLVGMIPSSMKNLCNLEIFGSDGNNINGSITEFFHRLPICSWNKLQGLSLETSNLTGSLPTTLQPLSNLSWLDLNNNKLTGPVPLWIGELTKLTGLDLSSNNLDGVIHEGHLSRLAMLDVLILSGNSIAIRVSPTWVPPFSLTYIELWSCQLGPKFPMWLRWQTHVDSLDISNTSISDIIPDWFWIAASSTRILSIQNNQITGVLPSTMEFMRGTVMDFNSNQLSGPIPKLPVNITILDLSRNNLVGPLPLDFVAPKLQKLFLSENSISGPIPPSLCKLPSIQLLDISGNKLTGSIPRCQDNEFTANMTSLSILNLNLRNNNLSGDFPSFFRNCQQLIILDLAHNRFSGTLPAWIGEKLTSLAILRLRSNMFYGHIPVDLKRLVNLQYLDLAYNNISGSLPKSIVNWTGMSQTRANADELQHALIPDAIYYEFEHVYPENFTVLTKGQERLYTGEIIYMVNLDLAYNHLTGQIPKEIGTLVALKSLNLSWNAFIGKIPENIGALMQVESLDLSHNELSGEIPTSLSALTSLSRLNLSYNNLTGEIPSGNQLQALADEASIYFGNPGLCGPPLSKKCTQPGPILAPLQHHEDVSDVASFFLATGSGCVVGLWIVFCTFLFKRKWRVNWFLLCDSMYDWVYVQVAVRWASLTRKNG